MADPDAPPLPPRDPGQRRLARGSVPRRHTPKTILSFCHNEWMALADRRGDTAVMPVSRETATSVHQRFIAPPKIDAPLYTAMQRVSKKADNGQEDCESIFWERAPGS